MTVCISAICRSAPAIIVSSDRMVSMPGFSADGMINKDQFVCTGWVAQLAGDISQATSILKNPQMKLKFAIDSNESFSYVENLFVESYKRQRKCHIESSILSPYSISLDQFMLSGRAMFSERDHETLVQHIKDGSIGAQLLISGFDAQEDPHMFAVCDPGVSTDYTKIGFWSIGSGTNSALGMMFANRYDPSEELSLCIYKVLAAKFAAESAEGVGKDTILYVLTPKAPVPLWLTPEEIRQIRSKYELLARVPKGIEDDIKGYLNNSHDAIVKWLTPIAHPTGVEKVLSESSQETNASTYGGNN